MNFKHDFAEHCERAMRSLGIKVDCYQINKNWKSLSQDEKDSEIIIQYMESVSRYFLYRNTFIVHYSKELIESLPLLTQQEALALENIKESLSTGKSIESYLSKRIKRVGISNDDRLLKEWKIFHVHLKTNSAVASNHEKVLLFTHDESNVYFIDIIKHPKGIWFSKRYIEIIYNNWPYLLKILHGITGLTHNTSDERIHQLTTHGVNVALDINGVCVMPSGYGIMASNHAFISIRDHDYIIKLLSIYEKNLIRLFNFSNSPPQFNNVNFKLEIDSDGWCKAYDQKSKLCIKLFRFATY